MLVGGLDGVLAVARVGIRSSYFLALLYEGLEELVALLFRLGQCPEAASHTLLAEVFNAPKASSFFFAITDSVPRLERGGHLAATVSLE